jgi:hypothetical protein
MSKKDVRFLLQNYDIKVNIFPSYDIIMLKVDYYSHISFIPY